MSEEVKMEADFTVDDQKLKEVALSPWKFDKLPNNNPS